LAASNARDKVRDTGLGKARGALMQTSRFGRPNNAAQGTNLPAQPDAHHGLAVATLQPRSVPRKRPGTGSG